jgi:hypothetical protein
MANKHLGFTGSSKLITHPQRAALQRLLTEAHMDEGFDTLHHGDAIHGDELAHNIWVNQPNARVHIHPPQNPIKRAYCGRTNKNGLIIHKPKPYLARNQDIVDAVSLLIAAPSSMTEQPFGGTWTTVRLGRVKRPYIPIITIFPNGTISYWEEGEEATRMEIPYR